MQGRKAETYFKSQKKGLPFVISAGGLFGLKISQFPCVFASLQCYVRKSFIFGTILRGHLLKLLETSVLGGRPVRLFLSATLLLCVSLHSSVFSALKIFLPPFFCLLFCSFLLVAALSRCVLCVEPLR